MSVDAAMDHAVSAHGRLDIVVHAAGVDDPEAKSALATAQADHAAVDALRFVSDETWCGGAGAGRHADGRPHA